MKKWVSKIIVAIVCFASVNAYGVNEDAIEKMVTSRYALEWIQKGVAEVIEITESYISQAKALSEQYPETDDAFLFEMALEDYLDQPEVTLKAFPLIYAGCFDGSLYQGDIEDLKQLQIKILKTEINENAAWDAFERGDLSYNSLELRIELMEEKCMKKIKQFCQSSPDPFFNDILARILNGCVSRFEVWSILSGDFGFYYEYDEDPWMVENLNSGELAFYHLDCEYSHQFLEIYDKYLSPEVILDLLDR